MRVADVMSRPVYTIEAELPAEAAQDEMRRHDVRHLVVMKGERDLAPGHGRTAGDLASSRVVVAAPEMAVSRAAGLLHDHRIGCLPVVDGKRLVGIVTVWDLPGYLARSPRRQGA